ncbi:hypothetical protein G4X40_18635 [Rhodococcus sp. D2-41]|uniref:hypothetical protein n=1 Tax=Speluncibacter jeojiensis TaxID=2710754 RepID=UPI00240EFF24|nr:hypothetical protein [Rhodococcus sp. D2-41]MDG3012163.1 hypothetical protein [Rhodococcus sp. D2-41]
MSDTDRDHLAELMNECPPLWIIESTVPKDWHDTAEHILAAGYRRPRVIENVEELAALPDYTIVAIGGVLAAQKDRGHWFTAGDGSPATFNDEAFPARVLWTPEEADQ